MFHSHKVYCVTSDTDRNIWCYVSDAVATAVLFATAYAALSVAAVLDALVAGGQ